ncbi:hypothetical protein D3C72_2222550 [compost metagenome]
MNHGGGQNGIQAEAFVDNGGDDPDSFGVAAGETFAREQRGLFPDPIVECAPKGVARFGRTADRLDHEPFDLGGGVPLLELLVLELQGA